ncbi:hypothetical protein FA13DRAFT_1744928, partial [Coprinellus micaceus]
MDSAHAEAAVVLINAGADRTRENLENETPEQVLGVGGREQKTRPTICYRPVRERV